ncbi:glycerol-3-phosphate dehydrogenase/oxidase [Rhodocytophaga rosea]|uniref:Glycerol-3-phosphate dehydrogenase n=1 Tax=Rhodocytophaga rosea TaxID=2704465 RepID=A0A6C0GNN8_9BACT|nr:glycerol-3-phosphate dehydrogenase/oxidase [Rhodocytophaga rosea]QHT69464.1 glycerol-3-phosphate dehydrogenase/oxidase [Rhodocytophaga rosea]
MNYIFSSAQRHAYLQQMQQASIDLLVIGGGITGAGIALDAQSRGMQTALLEMQDFAAGTSSRSTKLVHGGLRYLKQFEFGLVAEVGRERAIVYENGPHVTKAEPMLLPLVKGGTLGKLGASVGLSLYDTLAGVKSKERRLMLNAAETLSREPLLRKDGLLGGAYYYEYRTDDARLTIEILKEAVQRGALALNYINVTGFTYTDGRITGVKAEDQLTGRTLQIAAKKVVNATGPWVDALDGINDSTKGNKLHITKGVHIVVDYQKFPLKQAVYFDTPDRRMIFAIPRDGKTYIGTTDTTYTGDLVHPQITEADISYLIQAAGYMFPQSALERQDIESSWVGLRPLIRQPGKGPTDISRKDEIFQYESGLITIAGGKLTGYRKMAERVVNVLAKAFQKEEGRSFPACFTDRISVSGGQVGGSAGYGAFVKQKTEAGIKLGLPAEEASRLTHRYGSNVDKIFERVASSESKTSGLPAVLLAQLLYSMEEEMAATPTDFFIRRTGALYFNIQWVQQWQQAVIHYMADYFHWDDPTTARHQQTLQNRIREAKGEAVALQTTV